ncbi:MAG TPA: outer membrane lipid asymmetry maintenance protein MlaD [Gammaproteobacteria bacterium]|nr:outer membrane lipid asymmetry maintenance protein MlaD [Gammaproteobacteria bacterium]
MKNRKIEIWVGLFVVLSIAALLMLALQVSGLSNFYSAKGSYIVKASFTNIGGLKVRSKVTICGVTVGRVVNISLEKTESGEYEALALLAIQNDFAKIPDDSSAKILTAGLLGDNYVEIVPGQSENFLKDWSLIELTSQAILLEDLISKLATGSNK